MPGQISQTTNPNLNVVLGLLNETADNMHLRAVQKGKGQDKTMTLYVKDPTKHSFGFKKGERLQKFNNAKNFLRTALESAGIDPETVEQILERSTIDHQVKGQAIDAGAFKWEIDDLKNHYQNSLAEFLNDGHQDVVELAEAAYQQISNLQFDQANELLQQLRVLRGNEERRDNLHGRLNDQFNRTVDPRLADEQRQLLNRTLNALDSNQLDRAEQLLNELESLPDLSRQSVEIENPELFPEEPELNEPSEDEDFLSGSDVESERDPNEFSEDEDLLNGWDVESELDEPEEEEAVIEIEEPFKKNSPPTTIEEDSGDDFVFITDSIPDVSDLQTESNLQIPPVPSKTREDWRDEFHSAAGPIIGTKMSTETRHTRLAGVLSMLAFSESEHVTVEALEGLKDIFSGQVWESGRWRDTIASEIHRRQVVKTLDLLINNQSARSLLNGIQAPSSSSPMCDVIRATLGLAPNTPITAAETRAAVLSAMLAELRQSDVGSCFGTAVAIDVHDRQPVRFLKNMKMMIEGGYLKCQDSSQIDPPLASVTTGSSLSSLDKTIELELRSEYSNDQERVERAFESWKWKTPHYELGQAKDVMRLTDEDLKNALMTFLKDTSPGRRQLTMGQLVEQALQNRHGLSETELQLRNKYEIMKRNPSALKDQLALLKLQTGEFEGRWNAYQQDLQKAKLAMVGFNTNPLLRSFEYTVSSLAEGRSRNYLSKRVKTAIRSAILEKTQELMTNLTENNNIRSAIALALNNRPNEFLDEFRIGLAKSTNAMIKFGYDPEISAYNPKTGSFSKGGFGLTAKRGLGSEKIPVRDSEAYDAMLSSIITDAVDQWIGNCKVVGKDRNVDPKQFESEEFVNAIAELKRILIDGCTGQPVRDEILQSMKNELNSGDETVVQSLWEIRRGHDHTQVARNYYGDKQVKVTSRQCSSGLDVLNLILEGTSTQQSGKKEGDEITCLAKYPGHAFQLKVPVTDKLENLIQNYKDHHHVGLGVLLKNSGYVPGDVIVYGDSNWKHGDERTYFGFKVQSSMSSEQELDLHLITISNEQESNDTMVEGVWSVTQTPSDDSLN